MSNWRTAIGTVLATGALLAALPGSGLLTAPPARAQDVGEAVTRDGRINENYYAAGSSVRLQKAEVAGDTVVAGGVVDLEGTVSGNSVVAGGTVRLQQQVKEDLFAAAGSLEVRGDYADDARVVGGEVLIYARVGGDLIAAGGRVTVAPGAHVSGRTGLAGGTVHMDGTLDKRMMAAGRTVVVNGVVNGDAEINAEHVVLGPTARINGTLTYRSPNAARIDPAAKVSGKVEHLASPVEGKVAGMRWMATLGFTFALALAVFVTGAAWFGLFPNFSRNAPATLVTAPLRSVLAGIVVVVGAPLAGAGLSAMVVGMPLAALLFLLYPAALLLGLVTTAFCLGDLGLRRLAGGVTTGRRLLALLALAILLALVSLIPILGPLVILVALLFGAGAFWLRLLRADAGR